MVFVALMALWFGFVAARRKQKWYLWAPIGLGIGLFVDAIVSFSLDSLVPDENYSDEVEYLGIAVMLCLDIVIGVIVASRIGIKRKAAKEKGAVDPAPYAPLSAVGPEGAAESQADEGEEPQDPQAAGE